MAERRPAIDLEIKRLAVGERHPSIDLADPHVCMLVHHDRAFHFSPERMCDITNTNAWNDITLAAQCVNRGLACFYGMTLLVLGAPVSSAAASWSVSPIERLHQNQTMVAQLEQIVRDGERGVISNGTARRCRPNPSVVVCCSVL